MAKSEIRGPLTPAEKKRRRENNLCAYCGKSGQSISSCSLATKFKAVSNHPKVPPPPVVTAIQSIDSGKA
jgi:hypothetical protein